MPAVAIRPRRQLSPTAKAVRVMLVRMDPGIRQKSIDGIEAALKGDTVSYEELRSKYGRHR